MKVDDYLIACAALNPLGGFTALQHCKCGAIGLVESRPAENDRCDVRFVESCPQCAQQRTKESQ